MTSIRPWDRAADLPMVVGRRPRPEVAALPAEGLPSVADVFTFMRDAELRFDTLRMRIEEHTFGVAGEQISIIELALRHPNDARVTTSQPASGTTANYELWISDGEVVRTYSAPHRLGTERPARRSVVGVSGPESRDLPGTSRVYAPYTALPMETLPETFVHPAGYCQNVLSTGDCRVVGTDDISGIGSYDIQVRQLPSGIWRDWKLQITDSSAMSVSRVCLQPQPRSHSIDSAGVPRATR